MNYIEMKSGIDFACREVIARGKYERIYLAACGGSVALTESAQYMMDKEARRLSVRAYSAGEFIHRDPLLFDETCLVLTFSESGNTPETVDACQFARERGALTVAFTKNPASKLASAADLVVTCGAGGSATSMDIALTLFLFTLLRDVEGNGKYDAVASAIEGIQADIDRALAHEKQPAALAAQAYKDMPFYSIISAGATWGLAYSFSMCYLMEAQWFYTHAAHSGEFFHGALEIVDDAHPYFFILGLDEARCLTQRALDFTRRFTDKIVVIDAANFGLDHIDESVRGYIAPLITLKTLDVYLYAFGDVRSHPPQTTRRYMGKVAY